MSASAHGSCVRACTCKMATFASHAPITLSFRASRCPPRRDTQHLRRRAWEHRCCSLDRPAPPRPDHLTSAEVRIVLSATLRLNATAVWSDMARSLGAPSRGPGAIYSGGTKSASGFYRQPMQHILRAMAIVQRARRAASESDVRGLQMARRASCASTTTLWFRFWRI